jgi:hypothetical protein
LTKISNNELKKKNETEEEREVKVRAVERIITAFKVGVLFFPPFPF